MISKQSELMSKNKKKKLTVNYILNFFFKSAIMFQLNPDFFWKNFGWIITARKKKFFLNFYAGIMKHQLKVYLQSLRANIESNQNSKKTANFKL